MNPATHCASKNERNLHFICCVEAGLVMLDIKAVPSTRLNTSRNRLRAILQLPVRTDTRTSPVALTTKRK